MDKHDFFISRAGADAAWAKWIANILENAGYTTFLQDTDFLAGQSFVEQMERGAQCHRTIAVASPDYEKSVFVRPEWQAAFVKDPTGQNRSLIVVKVRDCELPALLAPRIFISLVGLSKAEAKETLLTALSRERIAPTASTSRMTKNTSATEALPNISSAKILHPTMSVVDRIVAEAAALLVQSPAGTRDAISINLLRIAELRKKDELFGRDANRQSEIWEIIYTIDQLCQREFGRGILDVDQSG